MRNWSFLAVAILFVVPATGKDFTRTSIKVAAPEGSLYTMSVAGFTTYDRLFNGPTLS